MNCVLYCVMQSITLTCHPSLLYYFLCEEIIEKGVLGLWVGPHPVTAENDWEVARYLTRRLMNPHALDPYVQNFTLSSEDEELLCWIKLMGPTRSTPLRDF